MRTLVLGLVASLSLVGCATQLQARLEATPPEGFDLVDPAKTDMAAYRKDYADCTVLANQDHVNLAASAGAVINTAAEKATLGLIGTKPSKDADRQTVLKRCLSGRGYNVLR